MEGKEMIPKFRIFDKDTKEWQSIRSIGLEEDGSILYIQCWDKYEVDIDPPYFMDNLGIDFELMQSTGLRDKNGKEIFEGDIVKALSEGYCGTFQVKWRNEGTPMYILYPAWQNEQFWDLKGVNGVDDGIEVIGNIHEHSHLLGNGGQQ